MVLGIAPVWAVRPPPDYRVELGRRLALDAEVLNGRGEYAAAEALCERIEGRIPGLGPVRYERAFALNQQGDGNGAIRWY